MAIEMFLLDESKGFKGLGSRRRVWIEAITTSVLILLFIILCVSRLV